MRSALFVVMSGLLLVPAGAQTMRDPTQPPVVAGQSAGTSTPSMSAELEKSGYSIIVRDGKPFLAVGTRLYAQGQMLGSAKVERISETEVWLREGRELKKIARFEGIQRRDVTLGAAAPSTCVASAPRPAGRARITANSSSTKAPRIPSCVDVQP